MDAVLTSPGSYVVAVSGGVDSMVLLHILQAKARDNGWQLVVAHLDHGMRADSLEDRLLVQEVAQQLDLPFVYHEAKLGLGASEATAREARYEFLRQVQRDHDARAIVTAHHQDDVLETAIINILRGSGRKGLTALGSQPDLERPLLNFPKRDLVAYAQDQGLRWREDSTNADTDYLRNYVRHRLLPKFDAAAREQLWKIVTDLRITNHEVDAILLGQLHLQSAEGELDRDWFIQLPHAVAREAMAGWLRAYGVRDFDSKTLERLVVAAKTAAPGKSFDVLRGRQLAVGSRRLALVGTER